MPSPVSPESWVSIDVGRMDLWRAQARRPDGSMSLTVDYPHFTILYGFPTDHATIRRIVAIVLETLGRPLRHPVFKGARLDTFDSDGLHFANVLAIFDCPDLAKLHALLVDEVCGATLHKYGSIGHFVPHITVYHSHLSSRCSASRKLALDRCARDYRRMWSRSVVAMVLDRLKVAVHWPKGELVLHPKVTRSAGSTEVRVASDHATTRETVWSNNRIQRIKRS